MLPKVNQPLFDLYVPSKRKTVLSRPYLVPEEKILLTAQQSDTNNDLTLAIKQVIQNCVQEEGFDVNDLATFDLEYMFIKIRSRSVSNIVEVAYRDLEDEETYSFNIDLEEVEMLEESDVDPKIMLTESLGVIMRYPSASLLEEVGDDVTQFEIGEMLIKNCIESVFDEENVYPMSECTSEEIDEFYNSLDLTSFEKLAKFFDSMPKMSYEIKYTNKKGSERVIKLTTLRDFFTW